MPEDLSWSHFLAFKRTFFKVSVQNFCHRFTWYHWLRKLSIAFQQIITQNYDVQFALVVHFLHRCYTWPALLSAKQNRETSSCILLSSLLLVVSMCINLCSQKPVCPPRRHSAVPGLGRKPNLKIEGRRLFRCGSSLVAADQSSILNNQLVFCSDLNNWPSFISERSLHF